MRLKLIAGNWKMHGTRDGVLALLQVLKSGVSAQFSVDVVVLPPYVFLELTQQQLADTTIAWGAQNMSEKEQGALTGEISANMLTDYGCRYVIIGHSERRTLYGETDHCVAQKFLQAQRVGLCPIVCVGETNIQREQGQTLNVVKQQLAAVLDLVDNLDTLSPFVIAYEPVWAIGTGVVATPEQAQEVHAAIRSQLYDYKPRLAEQARIVYGGSVNPANARALFAQADIDGGLVGGASLNAEQFLEIIRQCHN